MHSDGKAVTREILLGFWKSHILHHASQQPVVGQWMIRELRHHGYEVSPGTMYPLLARMQRNGWLQSRSDSKNSKARREYRLTRRGANVLRQVRRQLAELHRELLEESQSDSPQRRGGRRDSSPRKSSNELE